MSESAAPEVGGGESPELREFGNETLLAGYNVSPPAIHCLTFLFA
jgi:hypothetical protein